MSNCQDPSRALFPHDLDIPPTNTIAAKLYNRATPLVSRDWFLYVHLLLTLPPFSLATTWCSEAV